MIFRCNVYYSSANIKISITLSTFFLIFIELYLVLSSSKEEEMLSSAICHLTNPHLLLEFCEEISNQNLKAQTLFLNKSIKAQTLFGYWMGGATQNM